MNETSNKRFGDEFANNNYKASFDWTLLFATSLGDDVLKNLAKHI